jgi:hypothetical protein
MARVKTTRMVRIALWALRIYLIVLLSLIGLKFLRVSTGTTKNPTATTVPAEKTPAPKP